ncbi:MAG: XRE family transcriptional regulator [Cytophagia bacterium]|nr:XRE family transcriptional regulator [Cytophagia bacterium]NBW35583.1 XRE family transcriptional regulator [Cytophagia bacterium]
MKPISKKMLATLVKEGRLAKGYTQKELAERTHISTRSIQRIENGDLTPRLFTIKTLSEALGFSMGEVSMLEKTSTRYTSFAQRIILSIGIVLIILCLAWAFIAQSSQFPETHFEGFLFAGIVIAIITGALVPLWRTRS